MLENCPLGKTSTYIETYSPELLFPIPRIWSREKLGITDPFFFEGCDLWNGYELSWLNIKGKPQIAIVELSFPCHSENLVESKSLKLYFNSFNQTRFSSAEEVKNTIIKDLSSAAKASVTVSFVLPSQQHLLSQNQFSGICLDNLDVTIEDYEVNKALLFTEKAQVIEEEVYSELLKSNCLATGQPDWGAVLIKYSGLKINHESLLKYIISYRRHIGFHEHCVEQIFSDLMEQCAPKKLTVYARYTRRGGLDINPFRSNFENCPKNTHLYRQ